MKSNKDSFENDAKVAYTGSPLFTIVNQPFMKQKTMNFNIIRKKTFKNSASVNVS